MWRPFVESLVVEHGPVETATALLYLLAAVVFWLRAERAASLLVLAGGLREFDLHNSVTSAYVFNTRYFSSGKVPPGELLIVTTILTGLALVLFIFVREHWKQFLQGLRQRQPQAFYAAGAVCLMVFTVSLDRSQGFLRRTYGASGADVVFAMWVVEETLELLIPLLFLAALPRRTLQPVTLTRRVAA